MKTIKRITTLTFISAVLLLTAFECGNYEPEPAVNIVENSTWVNVQHRTYEDEQGQTRNMTETTTLDFYKEPDGKMTISTVTHEGEKIDSLDITYTYNYLGHSGKITFTNDSETKDYDFLVVDETETMTIFGTAGFSLVFNKVK